MPTPQLDGVFGTEPVLTGRLPAFLSAGTTAALPLDLDNGLIRLRFVAHGAYGVTLEEIEDLAEGGFTWRFAAATTDGEHDGSLWRIVTQAASGWSDGWSDGFGAGFRDTFPTATVEVTTTEDRDGRDAVMFRWLDVDLPTGGTATVTVLVSLGSTDHVARWWIAVSRAGEEVDGIEFVEFPRLAPIGPVAARASTSHAASQARARHLLPAHDRPALNATNTPLSRWDGLEVVTCHPSGAAGAVVQPMQFEALAAVDPQDTASLHRILYLGTADGAGCHKQFVRAGSEAGTELAMRWAHRQFPPWAHHPAASLEDASRFGSVLYPSYPALVGCLKATSGAWWHTAAAFYRDNFAQRGAPRRTDTTSRTDLARSAAWAGAINQTPNLDGATVGRLFAAWADQHREMVGASRIAAQLGALKPAITRVVPPVPFSSTRGVNYLPLASTTSHCLHLSLDPLVGEPYADTSGGFWFESHAEQEIDALSTLLPGINAVRFWGSFGNWFLDPAQYIAGLRRYCQWLRARNMRMSFVLFNVIATGAASAGFGIHDLMNAASYNPAAFRTALWTLCNNWNTAAAAAFPLPTDDTDFTHWPEPLNHLGWLAQGRFGEWTDTTLQDLVGRYVRDIALFFAQDDDGRAVFHSYDLENEVNLQYSPDETPNATLREYHLDFCGKLAKVIRAIQPDAAITIGWAGNPTGLSTELQQHGCVIDYTSVHTYNYNPPATHEAGWAAVEAAMVAAKAEGDALGIPWLLSEGFVLEENLGEMQRYLTPMAANGGGGFLWTPLRSNAYRQELTPGSGVRIFDGIWVCATPAKQITRSMSALVFDLEYPTDAAALQAWMLT